MLIFFFCYFRLNRFRPILYVLSDPLLRRLLTVKSFCVRVCSEGKGESFKGKGESFKGKGESFKGKGNFIYIEYFLILFSA